MNIGSSRIGYWTHTYPDPPRKNSSLDKLSHMASNASTIEPINNGLLHTVTFDNLNSFSTSDDLNVSLYRLSKSNSNISESTVYSERLGNASDSKHLAGRMVRFLSSNETNSVSARKRNSQHDQRAQHVSTIACGPGLDLGISADDTSETETENSNSISDIEEIETVRVNLKEKIKIQKKRSGKLESKINWQEHFQYRSKTDETSRKFGNI